MTKKKTVKKSRKKPIIAAVLIVIFGSIIGIYIYQTQSQARKYTVAEYFEVKASYEPILQDKFLSNGTQALIHQINVNVTAAVGDAHGVIVQGFGDTSVLMEDIDKGKWSADIMTSSQGYLINEREGNFSVTLTILSFETGQGKVKVVLAGI